MTLGVAMNAQKARRASLSGTFAKSVTTSSLSWAPTAMPVQDLAGAMFALMMIGMFGSDTITPMKSRRTKNRIKRRRSLHAELLAINEIGRLHGG